MTGNNGARLKILEQMTNPFSYQEFYDRCVVAGIVPMSPMEYAQKMGLCLVAKETYPELPIAEAYIKFITSQSNMPLPTPPGDSSKCCSGGAVR